MKMSGLLFYQCRVPTEARPGRIGLNYQKAAKRLKSSKKLFVETSVLDRY
jgi:hypothetical protein